ncbi:MAG: polyhydroxyalkanoate depolymerase [Alphaproteobacteria bacterium]|nr:polyhydroxyalkanoate depolymerase [Alphaproteobacteria bacterium]
MLYHFHEMAQGAITPFRLAAEASQHVFSNPYNPLAYTHAGRAISAACHVFEHSTRPYGKPAFGLSETRLADGRRVAVHEEVVLRRPFCQLKRFHRDCGREDPRLLIVAPLSGHFATLLRGTVAAMLPDHDVYITDWRDARLVPMREGHFDLDDYIDYVTDFLRHLGPGTHVMAVCQPSVPVLAAVSLMSDAGDPARPATMTLMGGPIDTRRSPTVPNRLATERSIEWFEHAVITRVPMQYPGFMRRVYPGFLQLTGFMTMNLDRHVGAHLRLYRNLIRGDGDSAAQHRTFYEEYRAVMDLPADYYLQTVEVVFQKHLLPKGEWISRGRRIDPAAITRTALMTVEGELDDISGLGQTRAAHDLLVNLPAAAKSHYEQKGVGHYGVFNGSKWRREIAPRVRDFIRAHG